ncbi:MAG: ZIP family metal transporter [Lachnospiraceae bacterium]|nr:ZIP family metal transporter [Lachnospiraceae bacterium]
MTLNLTYGLLIPFLGTTLGAACVFFMKKNLGEYLQKALTGFAAGVMVAASIWSLIIPALEQSEEEGIYGAFSFMPTVVGFWLGIFFLLFLDKMTPHLHINMEKAEGPVSHLQKTTMLCLAVAIHNIPEGMAVGVVFAGWLAGSENITLAGAMVLALGIAIQNFPEGAIISMPLRMAGASRRKSFTLGMLSGAVEPVAAVLTILLSSVLIPVLPYLLAFAAGAMMYVVIEELIPETCGGEQQTDIGTVLFSVGFTLMMVLDVALS